MHFLYPNASFQGKTMSSRRRIIISSSDEEEDVSNNDEENAPQTPVDRERSFAEHEVEESPISKRLAAREDAKGQQQLRDRLFRKQIMASRVTSRGSASPVDSKPKRAEKKPSRGVFSRGIFDSDEGDDITQETNTPEPKAAVVTLSDDDEKMRTASCASAETMPAEIVEDSFTEGHGTDGKKDEFVSDDDDDDAAMNEDEEEEEVDETKNAENSSEFVTANNGDSSMSSNSSSGQSYRKPVRRALNMDDVFGTHDDSGKSGNESLTEERSAVADSDEYVDQSMEGGSPAASPAMDETTKSKKVDSAEDIKYKFFTPRKTAMILDDDEEDAMNTSYAGPSVIKEVKKERDEFSEDDEEPEKSTKSTKEAREETYSDSEDDDAEETSLPTRNFKKENKEEIFIESDSDADHQREGGIDIDENSLVEEEEAVEINTSDVDHKRDEDVITISSDNDASDRETKTAKRSIPVKVQRSPARPASGNHPSTVAATTDAELAAMEADLNKLLKLQARMGATLPDGGAQLQRKIEELLEKMEEAKKGTMARRVVPAAPKPKLQVVSPPSNPELYNRKIMVDEDKKKKNLFGGQMTDGRLDTIKNLTEDTLKGMVKEMSGAPVDEETDTPKGLNVELMPHQRRGLTWMNWRERQINPGGILADDMGLGKTISMIALALHAKNERIRAERDDEEKYEEQEERYKKQAAKKGMVASHASLVIAPASVIFQWEKEIERRVKNERLRVLVFHGPKNKREDRPKRLAKYDVVITSYNIITAELTEKIDDSRRRSDDESSSDSDDDRFGKKSAVAKEKGGTKVSDKPASVLCGVHWERIILDEAHTIKNRNSLISKAVTKLPGHFRWCLTGTPIHNNVYDFYSLLRFMRVEPFDELRLFKDQIAPSEKNPPTAAGMKRLNTLVKMLMLRRTKDETDMTTGQAIVSLKPKFYETLSINMEGLELNIHQCMFNAVKKQVAKIMSDMEKDRAREIFGVARKKKTGKQEEDDIVNPFIDGPRTLSSNDQLTKYSRVLTLLLRMRQAAVHMSLTRAALDLAAFEGIEGAPDDALGAGLAEMSLDESMAEEAAKDGGATSADIETVFDRKFESAKIKALLGKMDHAVNAGDKCVVVSQWSSLLDLVELHVIDRGIEYTTITGKVLTKDRQARVDSFNRVGSGAQVMLLSLQAGGVGLNLVGGNHLFLVDLHWNPALEAQACDRIYRMGQTKNVYIHKLLTKDSIEEGVALVQERKKALADGVLGGTKMKGAMKLTMADLKTIFDLDGKTGANYKAATDKAAANAADSGPVPRGRAGATLPGTLSTTAPTQNGGGGGGEGWSTTGMRLGGGPSSGQQHYPAGKSNY